MFLLAKRSSTEKAAWITGGAVVIAAIITVIGGPMYVERAIIDVSFGFEDKYPIDTLQYDGTNYFVDVVWTNVGKSNGLVQILFTGTNAQLSNNENGPWFYEFIDNYRITPSEGSTKTKLLVMPDQNAGTIKIQLQKGVHPEQSPFQQLTELRPITITFEKSGNDYHLTDKR